jgi:hypothetical protein
MSESLAVALLEYALVMLGRALLLLLWIRRGLRIGT